MLIAGFQKASFLDYPGRICAVVFVPFCDMNCSFCHNRQIISGEVPLLDEAEIMDYLKLRRGMLDAVVVSGGEPTLRADLPEFVDKLRSMGYLVKLDTNGGNPEVLLSLIEGGKLDYIAMDIKAPLGKYRDIAQVDVDLDAIRRSIEIIKKSGVEYEFRTTFAPQLSCEDIAEIARELDGAKRYYVQQYRKVGANDAEPHSPSEVRKAGEMACEILGFCEVRGL